MAWFGDVDRILGYERGEFPRTVDAWQKVHPSRGPAAGRDLARPPPRVRRAVLRGVPRAAAGRFRAPLAPRRHVRSGRREPAGALHRHGHRRQRAPADRGSPASFGEAVPRPVREEPRRRLPLDARRTHPRLQRVLRPHLRLRLARGGPPAGGLGLLSEARRPPGRPGQTPRAAEPDELRALPQAQGRQPRVGPREREPDRGAGRPALGHRRHDDRHHRAQARRGAGQAPRLPRSAHEPAEPAALQRPPDARRGPGPPPQPAPRRPVPRPRPVQGHQRLARPLGRRRAAAPGRRADPGARPRRRHGGAPRRGRVHRCSFPASAPRRTPPRSRRRSATRSTTRSGSTAASSS